MLSGFNEPKTYKMAAFQHVFGTSAGNFRGICRFSKGEKKNYGHNLMLLFLLLAEGDYFLFSLTLRQLPLLQKRPQSRDQVIDPRLLWAQHYSLIRMVDVVYI